MYFGSGAPLFDAGAKLLWNVPAQPAPAARIAGSLPRVVIELYPVVETSEEIFAGLAVKRIARLCG